MEQNLEAATYVTLDTFLTSEPHLFSSLNVEIISLSKNCFENINSFLSYNKCCLQAVSTVSWAQC